MPVRGTRVNDFTITYLISHGTSADEFDARTVDLLRRALLSPRLPVTVVTHVVAGTAAVGADLTVKFKDEKTQVELTPALPEIYSGRYVISPVRALPGSMGARISRRSAISGLTIQGRISMIIRRSV